VLTAFGHKTIKMNKKVALVTGGSSGIGEATAKVLKNNGYIVYAAARSIDKMNETFRNEGVNTIKLDLAEDESIINCVDFIIKEEGRIDVLINNGGFAKMGSIEETPMEIGKQHYYVNIFGTTHLSKLVIPHMRKNGFGKIVNISSIGGKIAGPFGGWYQSSKFAMEGMSDAIRLEVKNFGIDVIILEPGAIKTPMLDSLSNSTFEISGKGPYKSMVEKGAKSQKKMYEKAVLPEEIAQVILKAVQAKKPKIRYPFGPMSRTYLLMRKLLSDRQFDRLILRQFFD
jgi:short-subunit dehydrogenase